jgi:hypothetical protein
MACFVLFLLEDWLVSINVFATIPDTEGHGEHATLPSDAAVKPAILLLHRKLIVYSTPRAKVQIAEAKSRSVGSDVWHQTSVSQTLMFMECLIHPIRCASQNVTREEIIRLIGIFRMPPNNRDVLLLLMATIHIQHPAALPLQCIGRCFLRNSEMYRRTRSSETPFETSVTLPCKKDCFRTSLKF